jgi:hypothetical protein
MKAKALVATRKEAKELKLKVYQGTPCHAGHSSGRITSTGGCIICNRLRVQAAYKASREAILGTYVPEPAYVPAPDPFGLCRPLPKPKRIRRQPGSAGIGLD